MSQHHDCNPDSPENDAMARSNAAAVKAAQATWGEVKQQLDDMLDKAAHDAARQTPRTDAECRGWHGLQMVPADFARTLERELAAVTAERNASRSESDRQNELRQSLLNAAADTLKLHGTELATLRARVAELEAALDGLCDAVNCATDKGFTNYSRYVGDAHKAALMLLAARKEAR